MNGSVLLLAVLYWMVKSGSGTPGANFIELLSREFCSANIFAKHFKTDYQPKYINFTCKFGWYPRKSAKQIFLVSNFLCLAALWNWPLMCAKNLRYLKDLLWFCGSYWFLVLGGYLSRVVHLWHKFLFCPVILCLTRVWGISFQLDM